VESINEKEKIKKNVVILGWVLIAIHAFGFYQTMNASTQMAGMPTIAGGRFQPYQGYWSAYFIQIMALLGLLIDAAFIFYSWKMTNLVEKGRIAVSFLLLVQVLFNVGTLIFSIIISLPLPYSGSYPFFTFGFVITWLKMIIFNGAIITAYYMMYNYLNKTETKAVFAAPQPDNNGETHGN